MSNGKSFKRYPAVPCWICNILEGTYSNENKILYTKFGQIKRVRVVATIIDKREIMSNEMEGENDFFEDEDTPNMRIEFDLDDGTGEIRATLWRADPENYRKYSKGDIMDVIGLIKNWKDYKSISPEIMNIVEEPNFILLRDAEIIQRIKAGDLEEIPDLKEEGLDFGGITEEIDVESLFDNDEGSEEYSIKEKVFSLVEDHTKNGEGISFKKLNKLMDISSEELKEYLRELEVDSRIYQSEEDIYQSF